MNDTKILSGKSVDLPLTGRVITIVGDSEVSTEFGTGAVKVTPGHDPVDYAISQRHNLEKMIIIDKSGKMTGDIPDRFRGLSREACRKLIIEELSKTNQIEKSEEYEHNIGHCQRCETMVEPLISEQWFLKTEELAKPAIEKVRNGDIEFIPKKWEKIYYHWMENIRDWCISRQLWWGHRIPAYYCKNCNEIMVSETKPPECKKCNSTNIYQDPDVLDTWFSSALWPFSTLGWNISCNDFKTYYPTTLMATAFDIIFFWVARMIMMGIHFGKDIPFRKVLINGLIRDEHGVKMSKTKNNVIDPIDLIEEFGTDALRFTLAIQAVPGMDISLSINRIRGYKAFANKIWNASRFIIMNLHESDDMDFAPEKLAITDKWILHSLNLLVKKVNDLLDDYRINEAADALYHFFWHEYCDWYLEFSKSDIKNPDTRKTLKFTLFTLLQLLHPFMPYITDEIYNKIKNSANEFLLLTKYPSFSSKLVYTKEYNDTELLKKLVAETRKTRTENKIDPHKKMKIYLKTSEQRDSESIKPGLKYFDFLTKSSGAEIVEDLSVYQKGFRGVIRKWEILLPFENEEERKNEINRLKTELKKTLKLIENVEAKLSNENFINRAPGNIISGFKNTLQESLDKKEKLEKTIDDLS